MLSKSYGQKLETYKKEQDWEQHSQESYWKR